jgi:hypothetical protein
MRPLILSALLLLAACGTPQEQCINRNTRDLRTVEKLIKETEANIARGYALEQVTIYVPVWVQCQITPLADATKKPRPTRLCLEDRPQTELRPKAIDLNAERAKLQSLMEKRDELASAAAPIIAQCKAQYPDE